MVKFAYRIDINGGSAKGKRYTYSYGNTKDISIIIGKQRVSVLFRMTAKKDLQDFTDMKLYLFRDALRKAYYLHALLQDMGLKIIRLDIYIGKEKHSFDQSTPDFPFVYSMITDQRLHLTDAWRSDAMIAYYLHSTKTGGSNRTGMDDDRFNIAVQAFLAGKSRIYTTDRFLNYWTAVNALYSSIGDLFETAFLKKYEKLSNKYKMNHLDNPCIGALIVTDIKNDCYLPKGIRKLDGFDELYQSTNHLLYACVKKGPDDLYEDAYDNLDNEMREGCPYNPLYEAAGKIGLPLYVYLLLIYPYQLRCSYFHGSKAQPVISGYRDPEIFDLKIINRFLERYLTEKIPVILTRKEMDEADMEMIRKYCEYRDKHI